eukprot:GABV01000195.1.p1 GENE.GABV01000195.1~~GABV01000195.1.p1  ORF type:complete len:408 (+),score=147.75 GABV01000195.1:422-1645(+)
MEQSKLVEKYFDHTEQLRIDAGIDPETTVTPVTEGEIECPQCMDDVDASETFCLKCGHQSCKGCWKDYLVSRAAQADAVDTRCNFYQCKLKVPASVFKMFLDPPDFDKYRKFSLRSYVERSRNLRWCPAPNCQFCCEYSDGGAREILCKCGFFFCFKCGEESHRPATCDDAASWRIKSNSEAENVTWIIANTKACPKCNIQIEKNQGCNHMTCRHCRHEFCWLCKGDWKEHGSATGGYYKCNRYEENKTKGQVSDEEKSQEDAKTELQRYMHYYSRFDNHDKAIKFAKKTLTAAEDRAKKLQDLKGVGFNDVQFVNKAVETIIECRRLLKWTYVVGYYLKPGKEKNLFEMLQEDLEKHTEHLHELSEKPLEELMENAMRTDIINYTRVTERFRENLMVGIETGLTGE